MRGILVRLAALSLRVLRHFHISHDCPCSHTWCIQGTSNAPVQVGEHGPVALVGQVDADGLGVGLDVREDDVRGCSGALKCSGLYIRDRGQASGRPACVCARAGVWSWVGIGIGFGVKDGEHSWGVSSITCLPRTYLSGRRLV